MTRYQSQKYIQEELIKLNKIIDRKIIRGESYTQESIRHKILTRKLRLIRNRSIISSFFSRLIKN